MSCWEGTKISPFKTVIRCVIVTFLLEPNDPCQRIRQIFWKHFLKNCSPLVNSCAPPTLIKWGQIFQQFLFLSLGQPSRNKTRLCFNCVNNSLQSDSTTIIHFYDVNFALGRSSIHFTVFRSQKWLQNSIPFNHQKLSRCLLLSVISPLHTVSIFFLCVFKCHSVRLHSRAPSVFPSSANVPSESGQTSHHWAPQKLARFIIKKIDDRVSNGPD